MRPYSVLQSLLFLGVQCVLTPVALDFELLQSIKRSSTAFTEGFFFDRGRIIESTGRYGGQTSALNSIDPVTGEVSRLRPSAKWEGKETFGEGLVRFRDRYYQLTYDSGVAFVYDAKSLELLKVIALPETGGTRGGWGLAVWGEELVMTDGGASLYFLDPETLAVLRSVEVRDSAGRSYGALNMLQVVGQSVFANVFPTTKVLWIDLETGCVRGQLDLAPLRESLSPEERAAVDSDRENVINGIAYDENAGSFYVTGKNWPRIFKIRVQPSVG